jgi:4-hydroxy-tetrahydrodipicolinate reductase
MSSAGCTRSSSADAMRIAIIGTGRMGKAVAALATEHGHVIHAQVSRAENAGGMALTADRLRGTDVAIEFTRPDAVVANVEHLIGLGIPTVTGTTGWTQSLPKICELVNRHQGSLLHAANFSVGVHLFFRAAQDLARWFSGRPQFAGSIHEQHHRAKLDTPSGTALLLQQKLQVVEGGSSLPITSVRAGDALGTHTLTYVAQQERITLSHETLSRDVFAAGAVTAAEWLPGNIGVFTFEEMLFGGTT